MNLEDVIREITLYAAARHVHMVVVPAQLPYPAAELTDFFADVPGEGNGTKVMTEFGRLLDEADLNCYVAPASPRNVLFYARFGFERDKGRMYSAMVRYPPLPQDD